MIPYLKNLFIKTWAETEQLSIENKHFHANKFIDKNLIVTLVYVAFGLSVVRYFGFTSGFLTWVTPSAPGSFGYWFSNFFYGSNVQVIFHSRIWWIGSIVLFYLVIPVLIVKYGFKRNLKDYGVSFKNIHKDYPLYLLMLLVMLPLVYFASQTDSFQSRYPIFKPIAGQIFPIFLYWQIAYFIQFVAVEFFFRGFLIHSLKHRFGFYSVFISTIPYCMIHFGKPFGETIAAIVAGIVLGTLSLKSKSIVLGILIHYSVAITMDIFALYRQGLLN
jgi:membrane protease YdiL (CAAX protease family)